MTALGVVFAIGSAYGLLGGLAAACAALALAAWIACLRSRERAAWDVAMLFALGFVYGIGNLFAVAAAADGTRSPHATLDVCMFFVLPAPVIVGFISVLLTLILEARFLALLGLWFALAGAGLANLQLAVWMYASLVELY